jgi:thiamine biosynthesis lipoprotein ApbE
LADGYSTAVFVMGVEQGKNFMESRAELEGLIVFQEGDSLKNYLSPGLQKRFIHHNQ